MSDPLGAMVALLKPSAPFSKMVSGAGPWRVRRLEPPGPSYYAILEGECRLVVDDRETIALRSGDFVLLPAVHSFEIGSVAPIGDGCVPDPLVTLPAGDVRVGRRDGEPDVRMLAGYCVFGSPDATLLASILPRMVHVRGGRRFAALVELVRDETRARRPGRDIILERLLEVLLIEALRSVGEIGAPPGLLRGLADQRLGPVIRRLHEDPARRWTITDMADEAALSRSAFFHRFRSAVGVAPMEYLLAWRMALARDMLRANELSVAAIAAHIGYGSASAFSTAFARHVGTPPARYSQAAILARDVRQDVDLLDAARPSPEAEHHEPVEQSVRQVTAQE